MDNQKTNQKEKLDNYFSYLKTQFGSLENNQSYYIRAITKFLDLFKQYEPDLFDHFVVAKQKELVEMLPGFYSSGQQGYRESVQIFLDLAHYGIFKNSFMNNCLKRKTSSQDNKFSPFAFTLEIFKDSYNSIPEQNKAKALSILEEGIKEHGDAIDKKLIIYMAENADHGQILAIFEKCILKKDLLPPPHENSSKPKLL